MKKNVVKELSFQFALNVVALSKRLIQEEREYVLSKQLLRSGTAVGALIRESEYAESKRDFIHKLRISLKEANETEYWIELLHSSGYISDSESNMLRYEVVQLLKLLISIINKACANMRDNGQ